MELLIIFFQLLLVGLLAVVLAIILMMVLLAVFQSKYIQSIIKNTTELDLELSSLNNI